MSYPIHLLMDIRVVSSLGVLWLSVCAQSLCEALSPLLVISGSGTNGSHGEQLFNSWKHCRAVFQTSPAFPPAPYENSTCSTSLPMLAVVKCLDFNYSTGAYWSFVAVSICVSPRVTLHVFHVLLVSLYISFMKCLLKYLLIFNCVNTTHRVYLLKKLFKNFASIFMRETGLFFSCKTSLSGFGIRVILTSKII